MNGFELFDLTYLLAVLLTYLVITTSNNMGIELFSGFGIPDYSKGKYLYLGVVPFVNILYSLGLLTMLVTALVIRYVWKIK